MFINLVQRVNSYLLKFWHDLPPYISAKARFLRWYFRWLRSLETDREGSNSIWNSTQLNYLLLQTVANWFVSWREKFWGQEVNETEPAGYQ